MHHLSWKAVPWPARTSSNSPRPPPPLSLPPLSLSPTPHSPSASLPPPPPVHLPLERLQSLYISLPSFSLTLSLPLPVPPPSIYSPLGSLRYCIATRHTRCLSSFLCAHEHQNWLYSRGILCSTPLPARSNTLSTRQPREKMGWGKIWKKRKGEQSQGKEESAGNWFN